MDGDLIVLGGDHDDDRTRLVQRPAARGGLVTPGPEQVIGVIAVAVAVCGPADRTTTT